MEKCKILIVICTYNEAMNIEAITSTILQMYPEKVEILVVDDNSPDGTGNIVQKLCQKNTRLALLSRKNAKGRGMASRAAYDYFLDHKEYEYMAEIDADFSHPPKYLQDMIDRMNSEPTLDYIVGSRYVKGGGFGNYPFSRVWLSQATNFFFRGLLGLKAKDASQSFVFLSRGALERVPLNTLVSNGFTVFLELKYLMEKKGLSFCEIPIVIQDREEGNSKMSFTQFYSALKVILKFKRRV